MAAKGKAIAAALVGVGAIAAFAMSGSAHAAESAPTPKPKKPAPSKGKVNRLALSLRFAKAFGIPAPLLLATTYAQSGNRADATRANNRGGAWGYGQMTLATATEIWPQFKAKIAMSWDGTGKGLLDPSLNLALTAAYLSTWWKRYKANPRAGWFLTFAAYVLGPARVRAVVPMDKGTLPAKLPADFARVKASLVKALATAEVKKALELETGKPALGGDYKSTDPLVWTPTAVKGEFDRIRNVLDTINKEASQAVTDKKITGAEWQQWFAVYQTGHKYVDTASTLWGSNVLTARQHEQEAAKWRDLFKVRGAKMTGPQDLTRAPDKGMLEQLTTPGLNKVSAAIAVGGVLAVGLVVLAIKK